MTTASATAAAIRTTVDELDLSKSIVGLAQNALVARGPRNGFGGYGGGRRDGSWGGRAGVRWFSVETSASRGRGHMRTDRINDRRRSRRRFAAKLASVRHVTRGYRVHAHQRSHMRCVPNRGVRPPCVCE